MKAFLPIAILVTVILVMASCSSGLESAQQIKDDQLPDCVQWSMYGGNAQHTGLSPYDTSNTAGGLKWIFTTNYWGTGFPSPSIGPNGTIYVSDTGHLYALDPNGSEIWSWTITWGGDYIQTTPAIDREGNVYFATIYHFYSLNSNGTLRWSLNCERISSSPVMDENAIIYFGTEYHRINGIQVPNQTYLYSIYPNGTERWKVEIDSLHSSPAISPNGDIIAATEMNLTCVSNEGEVKWKYPLRSSSSPCITPEGCILIVSEDATLFLLYPNGTVKWQFSSSPLSDNWRTSFSTPGIDSHGIIFFGSPDGNIYTLNSEGFMQWTYRTGGGIYTSPAIGSDGTIFFTSSDHFLYAFNSNGSLKWKSEIGPSDQFSPIIGSDGCVYVGGGDIAGGIGKLYAFYGSPRELAAEVFIVPVILLGLLILGFFFSRKRQ